MNPHLLKALTLSLSFFVFSILAPASAQSSRQGDKKVSVDKLNQVGAQILIGRLERKVGHRLDWKRRQQLVGKAKIMYDEIDRTNREFTGHIQRAFHLSSTESRSLGSKRFDGRIYGGSELLASRIASLKGKSLNSYQKGEIEKLVKERDSAQKTARESMAKEIQGTLGLSYGESLALVKKDRAGSRGTPAKSKP